MTVCVVGAEFTLDELRARLLEESSTDDYFTLREWADHFGLSHSKMHKLLHAAKKQGALEAASGVREDLAGRNGRVPVYRFRFE